MLKIFSNGEVLEQVNSFWYLGAIITSTGDCSVEIQSRLGITSLNSMWKDWALSKELKARLMRLLVWPVATYGCETWTLKASDRKRISAFEMTSYRRMLRISWKEHRTNQSIMEEIGEETRLLKDIQRRKLQFLGHTARADNLCTAVLHGWISGKKRRGRSRRRWTDDIRDWMGSSVAECTRMAQERELWRTMLSTFSNEDDLVQSSLSP